MASEDITYCANEKCKNTKCERHSINIKLHWLHHSYAMFSECPDFRGEGDAENG